MSMITMRQLLEAGAHFGHQTQSWNPKMAPYLYGKYGRIHIINLEKTLPMLREALAFAKETVARRGRILFVGTKRAAGEVVREEALRAGMPYVNHRWLGGMLTNYKTVRQSIKRLRDLEHLRTSPKAKQLTKKELLTMERQREKLEMTLGGIKEMGGIPDVLLVVDIGHERTAVAEARRLGVRVIGIVDSNHDPEGIDYMIPANDDSARAIRVYLSAFADAILEGRAEAQSSSKPDASKSSPRGKKSEETSSDVSAEVVTEKGGS